MPVSEYPPPAKSWTSDYCAAVYPYLIHLFMTTWVFFIKHEGTETTVPLPSHGET